MPHLPETASELKYLLARRLGLAAIVIGFIAGGVSYRIETNRAEQAAWENALEGVRHFESDAMRVTSIQVPEKHEALRHLLDRKRFIGIRVFNSDRVLVYETWEDIPLPLIQASQSVQHVWPARGRSHQSWVKAPGERLIQVVLPLFEANGRLSGYLEGISRLDEKTLREQQVQIRNGTLTAVVVVLITAFLLYPLLLAMLRRSSDLAHRLLDANLSLMRSLGDAIAKRDSDTDAHNYRVTYYAVALAEAMGLPKKEISDLVAGAFLHDVGKIGISDTILLKPGKLTFEEFEVMKSHVLLGGEIVAGNPWLKGAGPTIRHHHERFDGTGYPDGLQGNAIPLHARIFAVVDVFDALTSERPYKKAMPFAEALSIIERDSGQHFDPRIVTVFMGIIPDLYTRVGLADEARLREGMRDILFRHFETEAAH